VFGGFGIPRAFPELVVARGEGAFVIDADGNKFLDLVTTSNILGHCDKEIVSAIRDQTTRLIQFYSAKGLTEPALELAETLKEALPGNLKNGGVILGCTGTEIVEFSIKLAKYHTNRSVVISFLGAHHGRSPGVIPYCADSAHNKIRFSPTIIDSVHVPYPHSYRCSMGQNETECTLACFDYLKQVLDYDVPPENVAAVLIEPLLSKEGFVVPSVKYMRELRKLCDSHGILLIVDEVMTAFGRTGHMCAIEHWSIEPDIILFGKAMGAGMPIAALVAQPKKMIDEWKTGAKGGATSSGASNSISCVAALTAIRAVKDRRLTEHAREIGQYLLRSLQELRAYDQVGDVRGMGLLCGIEIVKDRERKSPDANAAAQIVLDAYKNGVLLDCVGVYGQIIRLIPPLIFTKEMADRTVSVLKHSLEQFR
jgi:4-aminobutyrate aminotransferase-like enzyme